MKESMLHFLNFFVFFSFRSQFASVYEKSVHEINDEFQQVLQETKPYQLLHMFIY